MFKRRLAVLGTAAALLLTGLGGSAMADDAPPAGGPTGAVSCTTNDGQAIKIRADVKGRVTVSRNGEVHQEGDVSGLPLPEGEPGKVIKEALPASPSSLPSSPAETFAAVDGVTAVPAL
ncbi:MAG: hypothetical protein HOV86_35175, partial [Thermoactinospora sp.]|nr:hypothetical protein [Thermoactinospora sp.]